MRTVSRLAIATAAVGGTLLLAGPAAAQEDCSKYETLAECPLGGSIQQPATDEDEEGAGRSSATRGSAGGAASLPFTGGEVTLIALAGAAAIGGGVALTAAGRKRNAA